ncbi:MAG: beta strand repeat-containing protein [Candidatus Kapaibacteriota bacterium]
MTNVYRILMLMIASITALNITVAQTSIPRTLSIQGVLTSSFGSTPLKGKQVFRVGIYESPLGGLPLHEQIDTVLVGETGLYQFSLGGMTGLPRTVKFDKPYFIDISVNGEKQNMRIPLQSAAYAFMAGAVENEAIGVEQLSPVIREKIFPDDKKGGEKALANYVSGLRSVIAGGDENRTSANYASILGGYTNSVSGAFGTVTGGQSNGAQGSWSFVGGGQNNRAQGSWSVVTGGGNNIVNSSSSYGTISGGQQNQVGANNGVIGGGQANTVNGQAGTVGGGQNNRSMQALSTVGGGQNNTSNGIGSTIGGGVSNTANGQFSTVSGGSLNAASGINSGIGFGQNNLATSTFSIVGGGDRNRSSGNSGVVAGGSQNTSLSEYSTISGGRNNQLDNLSSYSIIAGGQYNKILSQHSVVSGGVLNQISLNSHRSIIAGGDTNSITHTGSLSNRNSVINGGNKNTITNSNRSIIGGGHYNAVTSSNNAIVAGGGQNTVTTSSDYSTIGGGQSSTITSSDYASISGGGSNSISSTSNYSAIGAGQSNSITSSTWAFIGSGNTNTIRSGSTASFIGGGESNDIGTSAYQSVIVGGIDNTIANSAERSAIVGGIYNDIGDADGSIVNGGYDNNIWNSANYSVIGGGYGNTVNASSAQSVIVGGGSNSIDVTSYNTTIVGGYNNQIGSGNGKSFVGGGQSNTIGNSIDFGTIAGGNSNSIVSGGSYSTIVGGNDNTLNGTNGFIGGGEQNSITGNYGTIGGGDDNTISNSATHSTIAGGKLNTISANYGTASGYGNTIGTGASFGVVLGNSNDISGGGAVTYGVAIGNDNTVTGTQGVAIGYNNTAASNAMALGNSASAPANEFHAKYSEGFYFTGDGDASAAAADRFTATFTNTNAAGNGINIVMSSQAAPTNANDFVRFTNSAGQTVGRIEGQVVPLASKNNPTSSSAGWSTSDSYQRELELYNYIVQGAEDVKTVASRDLAIGIAKTVAEAVEVGVAWADVGGRFACGWGLFSIPCTALGGTGIAVAVAKVATIARMALDVVQYTLNFTEANDGVKDAKDLRTNWACNRYSNQGVTYESGAADYAEWLPKTLPGEKFVASDIVGIKDGKISKNTTNADHCMVISTKPIVLGNTPEEGKEKEYEKVAFMGQVPVRVMGKVDLGDYILPSGKNDGLGIARKPKDLSPYEYRRVVGVAWSAGNSPAGFNVINVAVGMNHKTTAQVIEEQTNHIVIMEKEIDKMQEEIKNINNALITVMPTYKEVRGLESNGTLIELFKGLDFDQPKVVSARKLKSLERQDGIASEQQAPNQMDVQIIPQQEVERGYLEARQKFIDAGGDPETDPFYSRMERDPKYRELMLQNINRMLNKSALEAQTKEQTSKPKN